MKFVIPYALPLTSTGNSNWFTWYPKFWIPHTYVLIINMTIGTSIV
jgi:hypothetical protein